MVTTLIDTIIFHASLLLIALSLLSLQSLGENSYGFWAGQYCYAQDIGLLGDRQGKELNLV